MDNTTVPQSRTPEEIIQLGEQIYFEKKNDLEQNHYGEFVVIDVDTKDCIINADKTIAIQEAEKKYPDKLFFIAQIGNLKAQTNVDEVRRYVLPF